MPTPTQLNTERLNLLTDLFNALSSKVDRLAETTNTDAKKFRAAVRDIRDIVEEIKGNVVAGLVTDARHDERIKAMEKSTEERLKAMEKAAEKNSDRRWQLAPMVISVAAMLVSVVVAVVKK